jgi:glycogen synthase
MKICFICDEYPPARNGGIGSSTQIMARALVQAGHTVRVAGMYSSAEPAADYEVDEGVEVFRLRGSLERFRWVQARWELYRRVAAWARIAAIDLIEVPDFDGWAAGWPALPVPVVARLHGSGSYFAVEMKQRIRRMQFLLEKACLRRADFICSTSQYTAERTHALFGVTSKPATVLYNPVEVAAEPPCEERSRFSVVFSGTLVTKKGVLPLIDAWGHIKANCPAAELHMYGKDGRSAHGGSMQAFLVSRMDAETSRSVFFHGHVSRNEIAGALRTARVAVFPSYSEAFAMAPMEAMAQACPTVYSVRASGTELIQDGRNGILIDPDRPEEIAGAVTRILTDDGLAHRLGHAGWDHVRNHFERRSVVARNIDFYRSSIEDFQMPVTSSRQEAIRRAAS